MGQGLPPALVRKDVDQLDFGHFGGPVSLD
jgi:hypothetical protein